MRGDRTVERIRRRLSLGSEDGMATVEYLVGLLAVVAFAMVLYSVLTGDSVIARVHELVERALSVNI